MEINMLAIIKHSNNPWDTSSLYPASMLASRFKGLTVEEVLLHAGCDAGQMAAELSTVLLSILPGVPAAEKFVAVTVELLPAMVTTFSVYKREKHRGRDQERGLKHATAQ